MRWPAHRAVAFCAAMAMLGAVLTIVAHREMRGAGGWAQGWLVPLVGLAFVVAGVVSRAGSLVRSLVVAVGLTWLLPTFVPETLLLHQAVLLVLIGVFPTGRLRTPGWFLVAGAALVALLLVPQLGVAALLLVAAVVAATELRQERATAVVAVVSAVTVAATLAALWLLERDAGFAFDPVEGLVAYECVLVVVAVLLGFGRFRPGSPAALADELLQGGGASGLAGLREVLAHVLHDPALRIEDVGAVVGALDQGGVAVPRLIVFNGERPVAHVYGDSPALDDAPTAEAVRKAVLLVRSGVERRDALAVQRVEFEQVQRRLRGAADGEQASAAARLRGHVIAPLEHLDAPLQELAGRVDDELVRSALLVAVEEITRVSSCIEGLVMGAPPAVLGGGRLGDALRRLGEECHLQVRVDIGPHTAADSATETALFYVASEAVVNAQKHAHASALEVDLTSRGGQLWLTVRDDGIGGADQGGSGLRGLDDRVTLLGGRLEVTSPTAGGTAVTAVVPL